MYVTIHICIICANIYRSIRVYLLCMSACIYIGLYASRVYTLDAFITGYMCMCIHLYTYTRIYIDVYMHAYMLTGRCIYMYICVNTYICMHV